MDVQAQALQSRKMAGMPDELQLPDVHPYSAQAAGPAAGQQAEAQSLNPQQSNNPFLNSGSASTQTAPQIAVQQSSPRTSMYAPQNSHNTLPGSLQSATGSAAGPSSSGRHGLSHSSYNSPGALHINTNAQQYSLPTRPNAGPRPGSAQGVSHSYSHSGPAGLTEQKYIPFSVTTPGEMNKMAQTLQQQRTHYPAQSPSASNMPALQSPLVLDQIRPRANSTLDDIHSHGDMQPTNCNYIAPWAVFAFDWCKYPIMAGNSAGRIAIGSYLEDPHNFIQIIDTVITPQDSAPGYGIEYNRIAEATCSYPVTRVLWEPPISQKQSTDLLATSGDHLRLWSLPNSTASSVSSTINRSASINTLEKPAQKLTPLALLSNSKTPEHTAPLTSLDWNTLSPKLIITSSIDTTCTIWDIPTLTAKTQLIAHDKEVYDVRFCAGSVDVFVSCGADGSVRMFDLRSLEHSTIIYEPSDKSTQDTRLEAAPPSPPRATAQSLLAAPPLLRLAASPHDSHLLATFAADSNTVRILDVRQPGQALLELRGHSAAINAVEWSPSRRGVLATGADDSLVLIWDLLNPSNGANLNGLDDASNDVLQQQPTPTAANATNMTSTTNLPSPLLPSSAGGQQNSQQSSNPQPPQSKSQIQPPSQPQPGQQVPVSAKGPASSWLCGFEVGNLSWAPQSGLTSQGGEWLAVSGGRSIWGVKL